jgi:hypothetical protein
MLEEIQKFFYDIHGEEQVNFNCIKKGIPAKKINGLYNENTIHLLKKMNDQNYEIYFVVNGGGYKAEKITRVTAVFGDFDGGRDEEGKYFPLDLVAKYKEAKLLELKQFPLKPTYIIETRNGFHVYWLLYDGATLEQFEECENRIIGHFGADPKAKNPNRLLRVPGSLWCKDPNNKQMTTIIEHNEVRYKIEDIIHNLPEVVVQGDLGGTKRNKCINYVSVIDTKNPNATEAKPVSNIELIHRQDIEALQERLNPEPVKLSSHSEVYEYLKHQDLEKFLDRYGRIHCILPEHDDKNPSAGIFINAKSGDYIYNCHSANCGCKGNIIQVTERLTGLTRIDALRFLRKVYRIEYIETDWQKRQKEILEENKRLITSEEFKEIYSDVFARMKSYMPELIVLHELALEHVTTKTFTDSNGYPVFFAGISWIADLCHANRRRVTDRIALLAYLGLVRKLPESDIPEVMLKSAKGYARKTGRRRIAFYSIPPYDEKTLSFSRHKARAYKDRGLTMKGWGREAIWRTFGEAEADRVYPQEIGKPLTELSEEATRLIINIIFMLLENKGWTKESEVLEQLELHLTVHKQFIQKHVKRVLPELLDAYGLAKKRLNKELKQLLKIQLKGYPMIIVREEQLLDLEIEKIGEKENGQFLMDYPNSNFKKILMARL